MTANGSNGGSSIDDLVAQAERLITAMESIAHKSGISVAELKERASRTEARQKRQRHFIAALATSFALILAMTVALALIGVGVQNQAREIEALQGKVTEQALCPLYRQFINADTPAARQMAEKTGQDMKVRDHAFKVIRDGYKVLDCKPPINDKG
ncbi:hypothetical protein ACFWPU_01225 [Streptomyces sp. NPDC058471]|uniref:hypothetical protein n=1 Tax=Streptomyces sp. NPDC058471 TaxID=3346516 RepID=UPI003658995B